MRVLILRFTLASEHLTPDDVPLYFRFIVRGLTTELCSVDLLLKSYTM
jgi:hypothetical protein